MDQQDPDPTAAAGHSGGVSNWRWREVSSVSWQGEQQQQQKQEEPKKKNITCLKDIPEPELTAEEKSQKDPGALKLYIAVKKCLSVGQFGFLSLTQVDGLLHKVADGPPQDKHGNIVGSVRLIVNGLEPPSPNPWPKPGHPFKQFRFIWEKDVDKITLLNHWLTSRAQRGVIKCFKPSHVESIGRHKQELQIIAQSPIDGLYGRAEAVQNLTRIPNDRTRVLMQDTGYYATVPTKTLKVIRIGGFTMDYLSTPCVLADVNDNDFGHALKSMVDNDFLKIVSNYSKNMTLKVKGTCPHTNVAEVYLHIDYNGKDICLNNVLQKQYEKLWSVVPSLPPPMPSIHPTAAEMAKQLHADIETDICKPPLNIDKGVHIFQISYITSPTQFYMIPATTDPTVTIQRLLPDWFNYMQTYYHNEKLCKQFELKTSRVFQNRCYVWNYFGSGIYERCRVVKVCHSENTCRILMIDVGSFAEIEQTELLEIDPMFANEAGLALKGKLQHIEPFDTIGNENPSKLFDSHVEEDEEENSVLWSKEAVEHMINLAEHRYFYGVVIPDALQEKPGLLPSGKATKDEIPKFGMILIELSQKSGMSLNAELVAMGVAKPVGLAGGCPTQFLQPESELHEFDYHLMRRTLLAIERTCFVDPGPEPDVVTEYQKQMELEHANKIKPDVLTKDDYCRWLRVDFEVSEPEKRLPAVIRNSAGICEISSVQSPSCFYIQVAAKIPELKEIMRNLGIQMSARTPIVPEKISVGLPVTVQRKLNHRCFEEPAWYRAVVSQFHLGIGTAEIIFIDFGSETTVKLDEIYEMPVYFQTLSGYCVRVHLDIPNQKPETNDIWSHDAIECFQDYLETWAAEEPVYYFWRTHPHEAIELDAYNQNLKFHEASKDWCKITPTVTAKANELSEQNPEEDVGASTVMSISKSGLPIYRKIVSPSFARYPAKTTRTNMALSNICVPVPIYSSSGKKLPYIAGHGRQPGTERADYIPFTRASAMRYRKCTDHLFTSFGVNFVYEVFTQGGDTYKFIHGWDILAENRYIRQAK